MQLALESCSLESTGRLLESVSNYRSRWMVIRSQERQDPAYRATLLFLLYLSSLFIVPKTTNLGNPRIDNMNLDVRMASRCRA